MQGMSGQQNDKMALAQLSGQQLGPESGHGPANTPLVNRSSACRKPLCSAIRFTWDFLWSCCRRVVQDRSLRCSGWGSYWKIVPWAHRSGPLPARLRPAPRRPVASPCPAAPGLARGMSTSRVLDLTEFVSHIHVEHIRESSKGCLGICRPRNKDINKARTCLVTGSHDVPGLALHSPRGGPSWTCLRGYNNT